MFRKYQKLLSAVYICAVYSSVCATSMGPSDEIKTAQELVTLPSNLSNHLPVVCVTQQITDVDGRTIKSLKFENPSYFTHDPITNRFSAFVSHNGTWVSSESVVIEESYSATFELFFYIHKKDGVDQDMENLVSAFQIVFERKTGGNSVTRSDILGFLKKIDWSGAEKHEVVLGSHYSVLSSSSKDLFVDGSKSFASKGLLPKGWGAKMIVSDESSQTNIPGVRNCFLMPISGSLKLCLEFHPEDGSKVISEEYGVMVDDFSELNKELTSTEALTLRFNGEIHSIPLDFYGSKFRRKDGWWRQINEVLSPKARIVPSLGVLSPNLLPASVKYVLGTLVGVAEGQNMPALTILLSNIAHELINSGFFDYSNFASYTDNHRKAQLREFDPNILAISLTKENAGWSYVNSIVNTNTLDVVLRYAEEINTDSPKISPISKTFRHTFESAIQTGRYRFLSPDGDAIWLKIGDAGAFGGDVAYLRTDVHSVLSVTNPSFIPGMNIDLMLRFAMGITTSISGYPVPTEEPQ